MITYEETKHSLIDVQGLRAIEKSRRAISTRQLYNNRIDASPQTTCPPQDTHPPPSPPSKLDQKETPTSSLQPKFPATPHFPSPYAAPTAVSLLPYPLSQPFIYQPLSPGIPQSLHHRDENLHQTRNQTSGEIFSVWLGPLWLGLFSILWDHERSQREEIPNPRGVELLD